MSSEAPDVRMSELASRVNMSLTECALVTIASETQHIKELLEVVIQLLQKQSGENNE
jgi:hypothetical protein